MKADIFLITKLNLILKFQKNFQKKIMASFEICFAPSVPLNSVFLSEKMD